MAATLPTPRPSQEVQSLGPDRFTAAKATLDSPSASMPVQDGLLDRLGRTVKAALVQAHGSGQAAAITIAMDQSQMTRQLRLGTFDLRALSAGGEAALAQLGALLVAEFGSASKTKKQIALERLPELLALMIDAVTEEQ